MALDRGYVGGSASHFRLVSCIRHRRLLHTTASSPRVPYDIGGVALAWISSYWSVAVCRSFWITVIVRKHLVRCTTMFCCRAAEVCTALTSYSWVYVLICMPITPKFTAGASFMTSPHCELTCLTVSMKCSRGLRLSASKTEFIWCTASRCRHRIPTNYVQVGPDSVSSARDLGVYVSPHRRQHDNADSYQPRIVVVFRRIETDELHWEFFAIACSERPLQESGTQPLGLLQRWQYFPDFEPWTFNACS